MPPSLPATPAAVVDGNRRDMLLVSAEAGLRRCWHPVAFDSALGDTPLARMLLGTPIVVWRPGTGQVAAAPDRCPHRWARLSPGVVRGGRLTCPYHGWQFDAAGALVTVPQSEPGAPVPPRACLDRLAARVALGMVWVSFDEAPSPALPVVPELGADGFHRIEVGVIRYSTNAAAVIDNNTDATHVAFVHTGTFGAGQDPRIAASRVARTEFGIEIASDDMGVARTPTADAPGTRRTVTEMWLPFTQVSRMHYSDGSTHILLKGCSPVDDGVTDVHLTVLRDGPHDPADDAAVIEFELAVEAEDRAVLDTLPAGFPLDPRLQAHNKHDRPGIAYRQALAGLLGRAPG